jgi:hypothetical protein
VYPYTGYGRCAGRREKGCMEQYNLLWSVSFSSRDLVLDPVLTDQLTEGAASTIFSPTPDANESDIDH